MDRPQSMVRGTTLGVLLALLLTFASLVMSSQARAVERTSEIAVPAGATQVWVDVESPQAKQLGVQGKVANNGATADLEFKASPNGMLAIADVNEGATWFSLGANAIADANKDARDEEQAVGDTADGVPVTLAITFVDGNGKVLAESATAVSLKQEVQTVAPNEPNQPSNPDVNTSQASGKPANANNQDAGRSYAGRPYAAAVQRMAITGSTIAGISVLVAVFVFGGLTLLRMRANKKDTKGDE